MADANEELKPSNSACRRTRRCASESADFAADFAALQINFRSPPRCSCSRCSDPVVFSAPADSGAERSNGSQVSEAGEPSSSRRTSNPNDSTLFHEDEVQVSLDGEGEERENGYPLVADLSLMQYRRSSNDFLHRDSSQFVAHGYEDGVMEASAEEDIREFSGDAPGGDMFEEQVNDFLRESNQDVEAQNRRLSDGGRITHSGGESGSLGDVAPRNGRSLRRAFNDCRPGPSRRATECSFAVLTGKKMPALNRVPTLTYDIPMSPANPLRAMSGNKEYFANRSARKLSLERAAFGRHSTLQTAEAEISSPQSENANSYVAWTALPDIPSPAGEASVGWQATKNTLKERVSFMCCNELLADVFFLVGRGEARKRIPAHKFVLVTGSAVFDAMFNGGLSKNVQENKTEETGTEDIELPDLEPSSFIALLRFLYSDDVCIGPDNVMTTLYAAKKYAIPALEKACVDFLKRNLTPENAFMLLTQALLFDEHHLSQMCLEVIDKNTLEALNAEGFLEIDLDTLCMVLSRETLRIREAPLFLSVLRWAVEQCKKKKLPIIAENKRLLLDKALYLIRFPLMTVDEFAQHVAQSGILADRDVVNLFVYFTVNPKPAVPFPDTPRCCVFGKEVVVSRFQRVEARWGYSGTPDRIKFTVDKRIFVLGFGLHGSIHGPHEYEVTIQILHCGTGKVLASNETFFTCDGSSSTFRVLFKEPVEIVPCVTYLASARLMGPDSHYGTKGLRRIVHQSPSSGVVTFQFTYAAGHNNGTSVEDGQIPEIIFCTKTN